MEAIAIPPPEFKNGTDELQATTGRLKDFEDTEHSSLAVWTQAVADVFDCTPYDSGVLAAEDARYLLDEQLKSLDIPPKEDSYIPVGTEGHEASVFATAPESTIPLQWDQTINGTKYKICARFRVIVQVINPEACTK